MAYHPHIRRLLLTDTIHTCIEVNLRKILLLVILSFSFAACQKSSNVVIDTQQAVNVQLTYFDRDSVDIGPYLGPTPATVTLSDSFRVVLNSTADFKELDVNLEDASGNILSSAVFSGNNGTSVSGRITSAITDAKVGDLTYTFTAYNDNGSPGDYATKSLKLFIASDTPPTIDTVIAPDSLRLGTTAATVDFYAKVYDPFGLSDILVVYFNTTQPGGTPSPHNPYRMYDDGGASAATDPTDADKVAGDGIYTYQGELPPNTTTGVYTFTFYAVNRSGIVSDSVAHKTTVYK